jgi:CheY-like chemotaxis protein
MEPNLASGAEIPVDSFASHNQPRSLALVYGSKHFADVFEDEALAFAGESTRPDDRRYDCECADEKRDLLELARSLEPEVVVIDADMPDASAVIDSLLDDADTELVPIIVVGAFSEKADLARYAALGVAKTITKPITMEALRVACTDAIDQREGRTIRLELPEPVVPDREDEASMQQRVAAAEILLKKKTRTTVVTELTGRRVIVADDDPAMMWFLADLFRRAGADVVEARDGRAVLAACREKVPAIVVTDILMPGIDGFELCVALRSDIALRDVPVVLMSWKQDLLDRTRELGASAAAYLVKSEAPETIMKRACDVLSERALLEAKIAGTAELRGRLDGVSVRSLLELVHASMRDARVLVTDAACLYEIEMRGGAPKSATRSGPDGRLRRGEKVLATAIGVRVGRYGVIENHDDIRADIEGDLPRVLDAIVKNARSIRDAVTGSKLDLVERVFVDSDTIEDCLVAAEEHIREIIIRLANGASPRSILEDGSIEVSVLEEVLSDLAARGAIVGVEARGSEPIVAAPIHATPAPAPPIQAQITEKIAPSVTSAEMSEEISVIIPFAADFDRTDVDTTSYGAEASLSMPMPMVAPLPFLEPPTPMPLIAPTLAAENDAPPTALPTLPPPPEAIEPASKRSRNKRVWAGAAVAAFGIVGGIAIRWTSAPHPIAVNDTNQPSLAAAPITQPASATSPAADPSITDLPSDQVVAPDTGMIEVTTPPNAPIRIDGIDRGHGPKLRLALASGSHTVRIGAGPGERSRLIDVHEGRLTHADFAASKTE